MHNSMRISRIKTKILLFASACLLGTGCEPEPVQTRFLTPEESGTVAWADLTLTLSAGQGSGGTKASLLKDVEQKGSGALVLVFRTETQQLDSTTVELVRGVSRISLERVENKLPAPFGAVTLRHAFLCNVVGNQNLGGVADADPGKYINREATRGHVRNQVIGVGNVEAECKDLTFKTLGSPEVANGDARSFQNVFFYAFPNPLTTPNNGFHETFTPTATVLMVVVTVKGTDYYYPVPLRNGLLANTEYKVSLTLAGLGNTEDDPFARIDKGDLKATISVSPWSDGIPISETI